MNSVVCDYATRVTFAWDRLSITESGDRFIPTDEMTVRMSKVLGRPVSREKFFRRIVTRRLKMRVCLRRWRGYWRFEVGWLGGV